MKYALITRFAVRFAPDNPRRRYENREDWIDYRMKLFRKWTLTSVLSQTFKDFDWWFLVDSHFPGFTDNVAAELLNYGRIAWTDQFYWTEKQPEVGLLLKNYYEDSWVTSARLDSDDIVEPQYMELIAKNTSENEGWISFPKGFMRRNEEVFERDYPWSPFIAYTEYAAPFKSVFHIDHTKIDKQKNVEIIENRVWTQVDHGDNIKNLVSRKLGA